MKKLFIKSILSFGAIVLIQSCSKEVSTNNNVGGGTCSGAESITFKKDGVQINADTMHWLSFKGTIGGF